MLCMLLRKRLSGAKLVEVRQPGLERLLYLDFDAANELGDKVRLSLVIEIMGNTVTLSWWMAGENRGCLERVDDEEMSSQRLVQPGLAYELPPAQNKPPVCWSASRRRLIEAIVRSTEEPKPE